MAPQPGQSDALWYAYTVKDMLWIIFPEIQGSNSNPQMTVDVWLPSWTPVTCNNQATSNIGGGQQDKRLAIA